MVFSGFLGLLKMALLGQRRASTKKKKNKVGYDSFLIALESVFVPHDKISILQPLKWQPKDQ